MSPPPPNQRFVDQDDGVVGPSRWPRRTWAIIAAALWLAAIATLIIVLLLWRTPPLQPLQLR